MTAHLFDPAPLISPEQAETDRKAFERRSTESRKHRQTLAEYKAARLAFVANPRKAIADLHLSGRSWEWICRVLAIEKSEAWDHYFGRNL